ncbi:MAG: PEP-CTERM sorting domain-containing protein [Pirellulales bacterium]|nr:PEP-CTERM sorting domain-containing protein [Pirellulales bacterium]
MGRRVFSSVVLVGLCLCWLPSAAQAELVSVSASVTGVAYPNGPWLELPQTGNPTAYLTTVVLNGGFRIFRYNEPIAPEDFRIGDGINETSAWLLDFTQDPNYALLDLSKPFTAIELVFTIHGPTFDPTDNVSIGDLGQAQAPMPTSFGTNVVDLMNYSGQYNEATIRASLLGAYDPGDPRFCYAGPGQLSMSGGDDFVIEYARITITGVMIPEPGSMALLALGLVSLFLGRRVLRFKSC